MKSDLPLEPPDTVEAAGARWFSLLPPLAEPPAGADETWRCAPCRWTVVTAWAVAGVRVDEAA